jgi:hypothetical protein
MVSVATKGVKRPAGAASQLSNDEFQRLAGLIKGADSVELKLTVPESDQRSAVQALDMDPLNGQLRQVYFFDTPDLDLHHAGIVARARRVQKKGDDSVVKLRPVVPADVPTKRRKSPGFKVEVDAMPGGHVCSGSLKRSVGNADVREVVHGDRPLGSLFSEPQTDFLAAHTPDGPALDELTVLGPILVLKLKFEPEGFDRRLVAELWMYPDNSRILELSTKCEPGEAFQVAAESRAFLSGRGVDLSGEQETKTAKALEYFAGRLTG